MTERGIDVAGLLSGPKGLYLPVTTFAQRAEKIDAITAVVTHTLTEAQCAPRKTAMLRGIIVRKGSTVTNKREVDDEITEGHFRTFPLLAGHQGFGMLLAAGMYDSPMWWREAVFISFQSPASLEDEMTATAKISRDDSSGREIDGNVRRSGGIHTRADGILLEPAQPGEISGPYLPQNAWLEVGAHLGGGALAALGEFPGDDYAPIYLGTGQLKLPKELGLPGDQLTGRITVNSVEGMDIPGLGKLKVVSVNEVIDKGTAASWEFEELEFGFLPRADLERAVMQR